MKRSKITVSKSLVNGLQNWTCGTSGVVPTSAASAHLELVRNRSLRPHRTGASESEPLQGVGGADRVCFNKLSGDLMPI